MKTKTMKLALVALTTFLMASSGVMAADAGKNGTKNAAVSTGSNAFGQSFGEWLRDFWDSNLHGNGQMLLPNKVLLMPIPAPGAMQERTDNKSVAIGEMDLVVEPGTKLVLGILAWIGETYDPAYKIPDDQPWDIAEFLPPKGEAVITLDGVELINAGNLADFYYDAIPFKEPIMWAEPSSYHSIGAIWVQGIGIVINPLTPGKHTLTLYSWDLWGAPLGSEGSGWFNTWNITVKPPGKK